MDFEAFPKIPRYSRGIVISEKIDGTNAQVVVCGDGRVLAGSRTRYVTPEADNFGFAAWVRDNEDALRGLGVGRHFGEWYGRGIQRNYGLSDRRFALFNAGRWRDARPACCEVVPVLYEGIMDEVAINGALDRLRLVGSIAVPGFMRPEGIVVYHSASGTLFKKLLENDEYAKGAA